MKNKTMKRTILIAVIISIIAVSAAGIYAAFENMAIQAQEKEIVKSLEQAGQKNVLDDDFFDDPMFELILAIYDDVSEREKAIDIYASSKMLNKMTSSEVKYLFNLVTKNGDLVRTIEIFDFWKTTAESIEIIEQIYEKTPETAPKFWVENAYNIATNNKNGVLNKEQVMEYLEKGLTESDILYANSLSRLNVHKIEEILDKKLNNKDWIDITNEINQKNSNGKKKIINKKFFSKMKNTPKQIETADFLSDIAKTEISVFLTEELSDEELDAIKKQYMDDIFNELDEKLIARGYIAKKDYYSQDFEDNMINKIKAEGLTDGEIELFKNRGLDLVTIYNVKRTSKNTGFDIETIISQRNEGKDWSEIK